MSKFDFEIHVAFPKGFFEVRDLLLQFPEKEWDIRNVREVEHTVAGVRMFKDHGVDDLGWLVSRHISSFKEAMEIANWAGEKFEGDGSVSVEMEQVLSVTKQGEKVNKFQPYNYEPQLEDFPKLRLEPNAPLFEAHHIFAPQNFGGKDINIDNVVDWARIANLPIHEIVVFGGAGKVTTTQFFDTIDEMEDALPALNKSIEDNLVSAGIISGFKTVAERIITVGEPIN